jgi:ferredoxin
MKSVKNILFGIFFISIIALMFVFNSCDKYSTTYAVNDSKCALCLQCVSVCGQHAISVQSDGTTQYVVIDENKCIGCGKCSNACSYKAIYQK